MSLDWNLSKIKNNKEVCWKNGIMKAETHELIYSTIAVGIGEITEKNWREFLARLNSGRWSTASTEQNQRR